MPNGSGWLGFEPNRAEPHSPQNQASPPPFAASTFAASLRPRRSGRCRGGAPTPTPRRLSAADIVCSGTSSPRRLAVTFGTSEYPQGMAKVAAALLLERSEELARVEAALAEARAGRGMLLVIEGPAGIGKTALLAAARTAAA